MANIMVVDDSMYMRKTIANIVESAGHKVIAEGANAAEAIKKAKEFKPDLITLDIIMPVKGGVETMDALRQIVQDNPKAVVVMVSAMGQEEYIVQSVEAGAKDFVVKPFKEEKILQTIERVLSDT